MLPKDESPILSGTMQCAEAVLMAVQTVQVQLVFLCSSFCFCLQHHYLHGLFHATVLLSSPPSTQVNFCVGSLSASNLIVENLSVRNVDYLKVDRCTAAPSCIKINAFTTSCLEECV